jgi:hypothetical protein
VGLAILRWRSLPLLNQAGEIALASANASAEQDRAPPSPTSVSGTDSLTHQTVTVTGTDTIWLVPGIGPVKEVTVVNSSPSVTTESGQPPAGPPGIYDVSSPN